MVGETDGLALVEVKPDGLLVHEYVSEPTALPPIEVEEPELIVWALPALAAGKAFTVINAVSLFEQPVVVLVSVNT